MIPMLSVSPRDLLRGRQDLVAKDYASVNFSTPFNDFASFIIPKTVEEYQSYRQLSIDFIKARNNRIKMFSKEKTDYMGK